MNENGTARPGDGAESITARIAAAAGADDAAGSGRLLLGWVLIGLSVAMLFIGWLGMSKEPQVARQLPYLLSGGLGGVLIGLLGIGLLLSDDVRRDRARIGRLEAAVLEVREMMAAQAEALGAAGPREKGMSGTDVDREAPTVVRNR